MNRTNTSALGSAILLPFVANLLILSQTVFGPTGLHTVALVLRGIATALAAAWAILILAALVALIASLWKRQWRHLRVPALLFLIGSVLSLPVSHYIQGLRVRGLVRIAQQGEGVIAAIESYRREQGVYPATLAELTPRHFPTIPKTGVIGYPNFEYRRAFSNSIFQRYELRVQAPNIGINWDQLVYWPEEAYPQQLYGGVTKPVRKWILVQE